MKRYKLFLSTLISVFLFFGGIITLSIPIKFWAYFIGIPATQAGVILLILTFERIWRKSVDKDISEQIKELKNLKKVSLA